MMGLHITLWVLQVALGLFFTMVGYSHALAPLLAAIPHSLPNAWITSNSI